MRHSWRLLLTRSYTRSSHSFHHFKVPSLTTPSLYQSLRSLTSHSHFTTTNPWNYTIASSFSSEPLAQPSRDPHNHLLVSDIFTKFTDFNDIDKDLELNGLVINRDMVLEVLGSFESNPAVARKFFDWVSNRDKGILCSKGYNLMLAILGVNGFIEEFWDLVDNMKQMGYGVSRVTRDKVAAKFEKEGSSGDLERLKAVFATGSLDNSVEKIGLRVSRIVRNQVWGEDCEKQIRDLNVAFSSDLMVVVLDKLVMEPMKALIFFRWVEESGLFKHDGKSYNAMARVLGREDSIDRFWKVADEMRSSGHEMEMDTFIKVSERFVKRKMIKEAVDLYEFAMGGANKPSTQCFTLLLKKIVVAKEVDMNLFSRVVRAFVGDGNSLTDSMLNSVLKSLRSVGRFEECDKILKEMDQAGFVAGSNLQSKIAYTLSVIGNKDEANEFVNHMEETGGNLDDKVWISLIKGYCVSGDLEKASRCFQKMVQKGGVSHAAYALELLVNGYCRRDRDRALDAFKLLQDSVYENQLLRPTHNTYKLLIRKLVARGGFDDALSLLYLMKNNGFPPYIDPLMEYVSKSGSGGDAVALMKAMTSKKFPSTSVVLRLFEAFFRAGRHGEAQDFLSRCPGYIRNHADVLNLFCSMKLGEDATDASVTPNVAV